MFFFFNEYRAVLPSVTVGGRENTKTKYQLQEGDFTEERLAVFFQVRVIKMCRGKKGILDIVGATIFLNKCPRQ